MEDRLQIMKSLATQEAINLKKLATNHELDRLDLETLDPHDENECIYGQMTGDCYSKRANELIIKCCNRVYEAATCGGIDPEAELNGIPVLSETRHSDYHSAIEMIIFKDNGGEDAQKKIIAFLKDETQTLEL